MNVCCILKVDAQRFKMGFSAINLFIFRFAPFIPVKRAFRFAYQIKLMAVLNDNCPVGYSLQAA